MLREIKIVERQRQMADREAALGDEEDEQMVLDPSLLTVQDLKVRGLR
jgi:hypothetical protein